MWKKIEFKNFFLAAIIINLVMALLIVVFNSFLPPRLPLFYGRPVGETQLTSNYGLLIAPVVAFMLTIANLIANNFVKDNFLKKILAISALAITVLTTITVIKIIFLISLF